MPQRRWGLHQRGAGQLQGAVFRSYLSLNSVGEWKTKWSAYTND